GAAADYQPFGGTASNLSPSYGSSWAAYILAHIGQESLAANWVWGYTATNTGSGLTDLRTVTISTYACPSSPMPLFKVPAVNPNLSTATTQRQMSNSYVAIMGTARSINDPSTGKTGYTSPVQGSVSCSGYGWRANDGVLTAFGRVTPAAIIDGLSSTMIVGEWSDWLTDTTGAKMDVRPNIGFAFGLGANNGCNAYAMYGGTNQWLNAQVFNTTSIRYTINQKNGWLIGCYGYGVIYSNGMKGTDEAPNLPLNSAHPGGAVAGFADGSVRYLTDDTSIEVLSALGCRKDQIPLLNGQ
ncbi:MAG: DUF1559 domain-containing protein, partial [Planctomycetota bacterium]